MDDQPPFDPEQDTDCSRCNKPMSWTDGDGINVAPPEDPDDRLCHACVWKELEALRTERAMHRDMFGHMKVVIVPIVSTEGKKYQVVAAGLSEMVRSIHIKEEETAKKVAYELRCAFGVVADHMESTLEESKWGPSMISTLVGTIRDPGTAYMTSIQRTYPAGGPVVAEDVDVFFEPSVKLDDGG
jgi:hypothetical protein